MQTTIHFSSRASLPHHHRHLPPPSKKKGRKKTNATWSERALLRTSRAPSSSVEPAVLPEPLGRLSRSSGAELRSRAESSAQAKGHLLKEVGIPGELGEAWRGEWLGGGGREPTGSGRK